MKGSNNPSRISFSLAEGSLETDGSDDEVAQLLGAGQPTLQDLEFYPDGVAKIENFPGN